MYQDKANRKRRSGRGTRATGLPELPSGTSSGLSDVDIQRAAIGIL
jgi:hypothetical protein